MGYSSSQTREYCVATNATHRADRPDSSLREERWFGMTIDLSVTPICAAFGGCRQEASCARWTGKSARPHTINGNVAIC